MKKLGYEEGKEEELTGRKRELLQEIGTLKEKVEALEARWVVFIPTWQQPSHVFVFIIYDYNVHISPITWLFWLHSFSYDYIVVCISRKSFAIIICTVIISWFWLRLIDWDTNICCDVAVNQDDVAVKHGDIVVSPVLMVLSTVLTILSTIVTLLSTIVTLLSTDCCVVGSHSYSSTTRTRSHTLTVVAFTAWSWNSSVSTTWRLPRHLRWSREARFVYATTLANITGNISFTIVNLLGEATNHNFLCQNSATFPHGLVRLDVLFLCSLSS